MSTARVLLQRRLSPVRWSFNGGHPGGIYLPQVWGPPAFDKQAWIHHQLHTKQLELLFSTLYINEEDYIM